MSTNSRPQGVSRLRHLHRNASGSPIPIADTSRGTSPASPGRLRFLRRGTAIAPRRTAANRDLTPSIATLGIGIGSGPLRRSRSRPHASDLPRPAAAGPAPAPAPASLVRTRPCTRPHFVRPDAALDSARLRRSVSLYGLPPRFTFRFRFPPRVGFLPLARPTTAYPTPATAAVAINKNSTAADRPASTGSRRHQRKSFQWPHASGDDWLTSGPRRRSSASARSRHNAPPAASTSPSGRSSPGLAGSSPPCSEVGPAPGSPD